MIMKIVTATFIVLFSFTSCTYTYSDRQKVLKKSNTDKDEIIKYEGSRKYGNYIEAIKKINGIKVFYNLKLSDDGKLLHVIKYYNGSTGKGRTSLDAYRDLQFLITDTSEPNEPKFFRYPVNGYYSDTFLVNNVIYNRTTKKILTPVKKEEKELFILIDSLAKVNNIEYNRLDTSKILGWFKYIF
jgi:hypothetical protein